VLHVAGTGVVAGTDQLRVVDNEVVGLAARAPFHGIELTAGFAKGTLDHATISGNRLQNLSGHGIHVDTRLGNVRVRDNTIQDVVGGALVMSTRSAADYVVIEGNHFTNLGAGFNDQSLPHFGVLLMATKRADVNSNLFANVARQAVINPLRAAVMVMATGELRVAGNRLFGVGPLGGFNRRAIGIAVAPGFSEVAIDDNTVTRLADDTEKAEAGNWQALLIAGSLAGEANTEQTAMMVPGATMLATKSGNAYLTSVAIAVFTSAGGAFVRGNRLRSHASQIPAAEVLAVKGCLFDQNDIRVAAGRSDGILAGRIQGDHANLANNRFVGTNEKMCFELFVDKTKYAVLGNLRTAPIMVNSTPDTALPAPWNTLNVAI